MKLGHRGANHPVKNLITNRVEITSQNHGFEVIKESLKKNTEITHLSLFDNSIEGIRLKNKPVFSIQYHPESNPGPQDSYYLFSDFIKEVKTGNGYVPLIIAQTKKELLSARERLSKTEYYSYWDKEYLQEIFNYGDMDRVG